jgi:hypothetical protein
MDDVAIAEAVWRLRFYCWRTTLALSVATATAVQAVMAIIEGHQPYAIGVLTELLRQL